MTTLPMISRRRMLGGAAASAAMAFPMINSGAYRLHAASPKTYSKRTVDLVHQSLVIDMLGVLKITLTPDFYAAPMTPQDRADFKAAGITGMHHSYGIGGPSAHADALAFMGQSLG